MISVSLFYQYIYIYIDRSMYIYMYIYADFIISTYIYAHLYLYTTPTHTLHILSKTPAHEAPTLELLGSFVRTFAVAIAIASWIPSWERFAKNQHEEKGGKVECLGEFNFLNFISELYSRLPLFQQFVSLKLPDVWGVPLW